MKESLMNCEFYGQSIEKQIPQKFENNGCIYWNQVFDSFENHGYES